MEKAMGHAGTKSSKARKNKGNRVLALPEKSEKPENAVPAMLAGTQAAEQGPETIDGIDETKTYTIINGRPVFFLVMLCVKSKPDRIRPIYLVETNELGGPERGVWQCEQCTRIFHTRKAWAKHAGMIMNIPATCEAYK